MPAPSNDAFREFLRVGAKASMTPRPQSRHCPRYGTVLRGWEEDLSLIFDLPELDNTPVLLGRDQDCVIRMVSNGAVCAFRTIVLQSFGSCSTPHVYLRWPQEFDTMDIRQHQRLDVTLPCVVRMEDGTDVQARITDISCGGCRIQVGRSVEPNTAVSLDFRLPDGSELDAVGGIVRNVRVCGDQHYVGVQITDARSRIGRELEFYITTTLARLRGANDERHTILLLSNRGDVDDVLRCLDNRGMIGVLAADPADALYRMRLTQPRVLIVDHPGEEGVWNPLQFCALASHATAAPETQVILAGDATSENGRGAGIAGFVPPGSPPDTVVQFVERFLASTDKPGPVAAADCP